VLSFGRKTAFRIRHAPGCSGGVGAGTARRFAGGTTVLGVDALGFLELVLEDDGAALGLDRSPLVGELPGARGDPQLVAGVPAVSSLRAERSDQTSLTEGPE
jgi:hypothetical protein